MNDPSKKSKPTTLPNSLNAISSPASESGLTLSSSPDGRQMNLFGQEAAPASRGQAQAVAEPRGRQTHGTCGRSGSSLSGNAGPLSSSGSKSQEGMGCYGSMPLRPIWSGRVTPAGRLIWTLRVGGYRPESGFSSLPTPTATANACAPSMSKHPAYRKLRDWLKASGLTQEHWTIAALGIPFVWHRLRPMVTRSSRK